ncbi:sensor histidine kinase [Agromyces sp. NPDC049794]|uniref:sensor histidine kinase n=1 Tax=unclassified Agromyces TaxID=2639701 RepID=UPI0033CC8024
MEARDRWHLAQDSALAATVALMGIAEVWVPFESVEGTGSPIVSSVVILVSAALIALRRTRTGLLAGVPLAWIIATIASDGHPQVLFFGGLVPLMLALYSGVRHGTVRVAAIVCGSVLATILLGDLFIPELQEPSEILFHWGVTIAVFLVGFGLRLSERRAVDAALRAAAAEAEAERASLRAVAEERTRIARELHDILGHSLSVMVVQAGAAAQVVDEDPETARRALEAIRATGSESLAEIRRVVSLLREDRPDLSPQPGITRIPELIDQARADGLQVEYTVDDDAFELSAGRQLVVYRVVQESLTNIRRHTRATAANVSVRRRDGEVLITVTDDGHTSFDAPATTGHGLLGMRERVALYGGTLETGQEQGGWRVHAVVPVGVVS